jgi:hypothetical protein
MVSQCSCLRGRARRNLGQALRWRAERFAVATNPLWRTPSTPASSGDWSAIAAAAPGGIQWVFNSTSGLAPSYATPISQIPSDNPRLR